jgi:hypothetical protein
MSRNWKGLVGAVGAALVVAVCSPGCGPEKAAIPSSFEAKPTAAPVAAGAPPAKGVKAGGGATND